MLILYISLQAGITHRVLLYPTILYHHVCELNSKKMSFQSGRASLSVKADSLHLFDFSGSFNGARINAPLVFKRWIFSNQSKERPKSNEIRLI